MIFRCVGTTTFGFKGNKLKLFSKLDFVRRYFFFFLYDQIQQILIMALNYSSYLEGILINIFLIHEAAKKIAQIENEISGLLCHERAMFVTKMIIYSFFNYNEKTIERYWIMCFVLWTCKYERLKWKDPIPKIYNWKPCIINNTNIQRYILGYDMLLL